VVSSIQAGVGNFQEHNGIFHRIALKMRGGEFAMPSFMNVWKKPFVLVLVAFCALGGGTSGVFADTALNANDLTAATLTSGINVESFEITARADKDVQIKALGIARTADDGEIFNNCIDLRGGGGADFRSVKFSTSEGARLTVYLNSGSSSAARILRLVDGTGAVALEIPATPYVEGKAGMAKVSIPSTGNFYLTSATGGILIYQILIQ